VTTQDSTATRTDAVPANEAAPGTLAEPVGGISGIGWPILIGAGLCLLAVAWWAISYGQITANAGVSLLNAFQCLGFRTEYCSGLIAAGEIRFPLYYHFFTLWLGVFLIAIGAWRRTYLSTSPPEWFIPYRITFFRLFALFILIMLWWEAAARAGPNLFPSPAATLQAAIDLFGEDRNNIRVGFYDSLRVYASGLFFGIIVGIPIGLLLGGFRVLGRTMEVFMNALMATPRIAFIPLIILFLGLGYEAKTFIIFLGAVMPIMVNTYAGVRNSDGELVEMARSAGARRGQIFVRILLPGALPFIVVGLRIGATIGLINTVVAELYTATTGLGGLLQTYRARFDMDSYVVVVLCLALIGVVVTSLLRVLETRAERWRYSGN
jgi:ABC-type nitrate/sulfonate/bicarbonate transport system permease component